MSDYLWDKTGEPEEDVAQLENLLGALKYQPRPLDIPATAMPTATATTAAARPRPAQSFSRPRLALAASLVLTLLAGAWLFTRQNEPQRNRLAEVEQGSPAAAGSGQPDRAAVSNVETAEHASPGHAEPAEPRAGKQVEVVAASTPKLRRASRPPVVKRHRPEPRGAEHSPAPPEEIAIAGGAMQWQVEQPLTPQQREATEQLMLALRLASAKLNYAQREMQEIGRAGK